MVKEAVGNENKKIGLLCHITSLPSKYGIGDLGKECFKFVDFLKNNNFNVWEILPLNKINECNCPYGTISAFAFEELLIDLQPFVDNGVLSKSEVLPLTKLSKDNVDFKSVRTIKTKLLDDVYDRYGKNYMPKIDQFFAENKEIYDYCVFAGLKNHFHVKDWRDFPAKIRVCDRTAIQSIFPQIKDDVYKYGYLQMVFCEQLAKVKAYAKQNGVEILGDVPIYCEPTSCDVWAYSKFFKLDKDLNPKCYGGVPGYMANGAQNWGTCIYNWNALKKCGYSWWVDRICHLLKFYDILRIDHFVGIVKHYEIPANAKDIDGHKWVSGGGEDFLNILFKKVQKKCLVAEDFGDGPKECQKIIEKYGIKSMRVALYGFDSDDKNTHLPHNLKRNSIYYIGTHDSGTLESFVQNLNKEQRQRVIDYFGLNKNSDNDAISDAIVKSVLNSKSDFVIFRTQDLFREDDSRRMNFPGVAKGQWTYRIDKNYEKLYRKYNVLGLCK